MLASHLRAKSLDRRSERMFEGLNAYETKFFLRWWPITGTRDTQSREPHRGRQGESLRAVREELAIKILGLSRAEEQKLKVQLSYSWPATSLRAEPRESTRMAGTQIGRRVMT